MILIEKVYQRLPLERFILDDDDMGTRIFLLSHSGKSYRNHRKEGSPLQNFSDQRRLAATRPVELWSK